ncbi:ATP-dependent helicase [Agreia sp. COWG]|uniref:ATP-dependent helicase n=1 Tax=Agreia sp. COWG TaxID=2773266 RepID=UPI001AF91DFB|nr:ATP-dependent helicase [Agreia sp. COWG]CAD6001576.1 ATP-dependent DNA helicase UvrD2 [Agreia sp. COWG]
MVSGSASETGGNAEQILAALDDDQRVAARALIGPVCILAGAGTGKTRAITHRIAYGVATGVYSPNRVMALTFTSRSAAELRTRLRPLGAGGVSARTFHAAALSQLNYFWPTVVGGDMPRVLEGKARLLGHAAETLKLRVDTASLRDLAAEIEWRKVSSLSLDAYELALRTSRSLPGQLTVDQVLGLHQKYEDIKDERRQLDFEDVLLATSGMIEQEPAVAMQVHEQYKFFVVDEYQDVSPLQHHLLSLWVGGRNDLCVVGDASQTIYSFAGARSDYLLSFEHDYTNATTVRLEQNYRSTPAIVDVANRLMKGRAGALSLHAAVPESPTTPEARPALTVYPSDVTEARGIASRISDLVQSGVPASDIAVLYRVNVQAAVLETALGDAGVSYQVRGSKRFFDLPEVKQAVMSLRAASVSITGEPLFKSVSDVLRSLGWSQAPPEGRGAVRDKWEALNALMGLAEQQGDGITFRQFTDELMERQGSGHEPTIQAVTLATLHSAKGLEWPIVFLVGLSEGLVPISYATTFEQIDEERRLMYVGITRARDRLEMSYSESGMGRSQQRLASRFLQEALPGTRTPDAPGIAAR